MEANSIVPTLAKFSAHQNLSFCCNNSSHPPCIKENWLRDVLFFFFHLMIYFLFRKKEK